MDEHYQLTTPENVAIDYELAGLGSRFAAAVLDALISWSVAVGLIFLSLYVGSRLEMRLPDLGSWATALIGIAVFAVLFGYSMLFEIVWSGQTPGKRIVGLRVLMDDGSPVTATAAVIRNVVRIADFLPAYYTIGFVAMLIDRKARRLGDLASGTIVVKERRDVAVDRLTLPAVVPPRQEPGAAVNPRALSYDDYHLVKEYVLRHDRLAPAAAQRLAAQIATGIALKLDVTLGEETPAEFLARIGAALEREGQR